MIPCITGNLSWSIKGKPARVPGTDSGNSDSLSVCLLSAPFLDITFSPHLQFLLFLPGKFSFHFQIFENNHICLIFWCIKNDFLCNFSAKFCIQTFCICPSSLHLTRSMFPLKSSDPSQHTVHPVFVTGKVNKLSSQDSSVWTHDGTDCIRIDAEIHTADRLFFDRCPV